MPRGILLEMILQTYTGLIFLQDQSTGVCVAEIPHPSDFDPNNTTIFIGGLSGGVDEHMLRDVFGQFGEIIYTKVPANKGCGFCQFVERRSAEQAMQRLQGQVNSTSQHYNLYNLCFVLFFSQFSDFLLRPQYFGVCQWVRLTDSCLKDNGP